MSCLLSKCNKKEIRICLVSSSLYPRNDDVFVEIINVIVTGFVHELS